MENKSAFPREDYQTDNQELGQSGMTLRDYFAAKVMNTVVIKLSNPRGLTPTNEDLDDWAKKCYRRADAMLRQREL